MTTVVDAYLICDSCDTPSCHGHGHRTIGQARYIHSDWLRRGTYDYCPECVTARMNVGSES